MVASTRVTAVVIVFATCATMLTLAFIVVSTSLGYGVRATGSIPVDTVIGEYTGILTTHDYDKDKDVTSEYAVKLQTRASRKKVYIDAKEGGGLTRFINHSYAPNCIFAEALNRISTKVLVIVVRPIRAGADVAVSYGDELWFTCACGEGDCQSKITALA
ncbi:hypothetical protein PF005_g3610 [Phytophthora fragariae]|uniref:SET domain-containing protein n=1 Tax=Phytophthora fragariae TaxID=53985 RepID=A0A6A3FFN4_9STRA|nr:hypothetical protein PF003_g21505 [Phytophthora fragariae]KAE8944479.1 hypothetical protein PF009_g5840 [Phytophthora fragariae]KAE9001175.1 hypothetical protein PF011_g13859 [Phytophthora fragariae]KAE9132715.1 hypothetical protein PF007_g3620 [Phytophthora fragariae]KAE9152723.1 hypothetical protein PF006_g3067 [Phytophthora fragariae]